VKKKNLEVCAECNDFPCLKFGGFDAGDSFLTHRKSIVNLDFIKENGVEEFVKQQKRRIELLGKMLKQFDEGRSRSFYCLAAALLSIKDLEKSLEYSKQRMEADKVGLKDVKTRSKILRGYLSDFAAKQRIELRLRKR